MASKTNMQYVRLGNSGLKVSRIILGCMTYSGKAFGPWALEEEAGIEHIKTAFEAGINAFDTANIYGYGESERILGQAIKAIGAPRERFVILTKVYAFMMPPDAPAEARSDPEAYGLVNLKGNNRKHIFDSVQASLARLQTDYIDVLQLHRFDSDTPIAETMQALHDVVQKGWVRYIGMSSCYAWQFHAMQNYAIQNHLTPFISMQNYHSLVYREEEREMLPLCKHLGVGTIPWSPLTQGVLSRPRSQQKSTVRGESNWFLAQIFRENDPSNGIIDRVEELAKKKNISMAQVALAWSLTKVTAPIVGTTSLDHLKDMIKSVEVKLEEEEIKYLEEIYQPLPVMGHS